MASPCAPAAAPLAAAFVSKAARPLLLAMLRSQAYRELAAVKLIGQARCLATTPQSLQQLAHQEAEEKAHLDAALALWAELEPAPKSQLLAQAQARLDQHPLPAITTPLDLAMAQFVFDRAGYFQLRAYVGGSFPPYARMAEQIVREEAEHQSQGETTLLELKREGFDPAAQVCFERWLTVSLLSFGRAGSAGDKQAVELGLKTKSAAAIMQDFVDDLRPTLVRAGLTFPSHEQLARLGVQVPEQIRL